MARGINKVILIGRLGADPDARYMPSGKAVTNIRIATSEAWKNRESGEAQERTEWHSIVLFDRLGEIAADYLRKGAQVYIEGSLRTRKWQDKEGRDRYTTEIVARTLQMLERRANGGSTRTASDGAHPNQPNQQAAQQPLPGAHYSPQNFDSYGDMNGFDDDIPF